MRNCRIARQNSSAELREFAESMSVSGTQLSDNSNEQLSVVVAARDSLEDLVGKTSENAKSVSEAHKTADTTHELAETGSENMKSMAKAMDALFLSRVEASPRSSKRSMRSHFRPISWLSTRLSKLLEQAKQGRGLQSLPMKCAPWRSAVLQQLRRRRKRSKILFRKANMALMCATP